MIVVIADDLTGAAEMAGIGLKYGFKIEIAASIVPSKVDLLIIAANTRSMMQNEAYHVSVELAKKLEDIEYEWVYKKTDSVLRGHILVEMMALLKYGKKKKSLLVPANPKMKRRIQNGIYYINDKPLTETRFVNDPEFQIHSANVMELLGRSLEINTILLKPDDAVHFTGIGLGQAESTRDLEVWAEKIDENILPAGGAEFFEAILNHQLKRNKQEPILYKPDRQSRVLVVCGSTFRNNKQAIEIARTHGARVSEMPDDVFYLHADAESVRKKWTGQIIGLYKETHTVIIEINKPVQGDIGFSKYLSKTLAQTVRRVISAIDIRELFIEGGETAFVILEAAGYATFYPFQEIAPGIIRMRIHENPNILVTLKPGSYKWPDDIWKYDKP